ncbi:MAG TPA: CHASE2 domain-containing protein [Noviherbaspirillum sp.]|uniref:CHASE2 domain-containing protein n=1 Tax=Noviherbaspirillum sp. TaxID=1926288 RepID=UPI002D6EF60E|nr:CHASE2 domain-containing protein [Noviherbaspirillum sp.]HYD97424.1 CHASE2 domain-containing protein [Noviherbaspirillum sp.]
MTLEQQERQHPYERYSVFARALLTVVLSILVGLALALATNGMPAAEAAKRMAARAYLPLLTSAYPTAGRDRITVLAIDDLDLEHLGLSWPVPMDYYQRLIDKLVSLKPKAVFIDILFLDDRPKHLVERFRSAACAARDAGVPVYIASLEGQRRASRTMEQLAEPDAGGKPCFQFVAPNLLDDHFDHSTWEYPLQPGLRSPALALACDVGQACPKPEETMALLWPVNGHPVNPELHLRENEDGELEPSCVNRIGWYDTVPLLPRVVRNWLRGGPPQTICPYNLQLPIRALSGVGMSEAERREAIEGKIVLFGTAFQSSGDRVSSPLGQDLIGVHAHAIALDNLISLEGQYRRSGDFELGRITSPASLFTMSALALIAAGSVLWHCFTWGTKRAGGAGTGQAPAQTGSVAQSINARLARFLHRPQLNSTPWTLRAPVVGLRVLVILPLLALGLGRWPFRPDPDAPPLAQRLLRALLAVALFLIGMLAVFWLGDSYFQVGPLAVIEYFLFPLGVDFLDRGNFLARHAAVFIDACLKPDPVGELRYWMHSESNDG